MNRVVAPRSKLAFADWWATTAANRWVRDQAPVEGTRSDHRPDNRSRRRVYSSASISPRANRSSRIVRAFASETPACIGSADRGWSCRRSARTSATTPTLLLAQGLDIAEVAARLGDTTQVVLTTYVHMIPNRGDRTRQAIASTWGDGFPTSQASVPQLGGWRPKRGSNVVRAV